MFRIVDGKLLEVLNKHLMNIVIPEGVTEIALNAFCGCTKIRTISLPKSLKNPPANLFC